MYNGFTFNDIHSSAFPGLIVNKIHRSFSVSRSLVKRKVPRKKGFILQGIEEDAIIQKIDITVEGTTEKTYDQVLDELRGWLLLKKPANLSTDIESNRFTQSIVADSSELDEIAKFGQGTLTFVAPDGIKYGDEKTYVFTDDTVNLVNNGTDETKGILTATFISSASNYKITHQETGKYVRINFDFGEFDELEIDFGKRKITINGEVNMPSLDWPSSRWFNLDPGENTLNVTPVDVADTEISFTERWL